VLLNSKHLHRRLSHPTPVESSVSALVVGTDYNSTNMIHSSHSSLHGVLKWIQLRIWRIVPTPFFTTGGFKDLFHPGLLLFILGGTISYSTKRPEVGSSEVRELHR
jgi:hypothetical protein